MSHCTYLPKRTSAPGPAVPQCQLLFCSPLSFFPWGLPHNIPTGAEQACSKTNVTTTIIMDTECTPTQLRPPCIMGMSLLGFLKRNDYTGFQMREHRRLSFPSTSFMWEKPLGFAYCEGLALPHLAPHSSLLTSS